MESFYFGERGRFVSTEQTRGPWSAAHQHGGPVAALLARELEHRLAADGAGDFHPARFTIEFLKPVPIAPLEVATEVVRAGRKARSLAATCAVTGEPVARALALFLRSRTLDVVVAPPVTTPPSPNQATPYAFTFFREPRGYHTAVELRLARGSWGSGALTVWMRLRVPVVAGEAPSPFQRVLVAADSGNGVSAALDPARFSFVNPDLTVYLHRVPAGEWICLDATTTISPGGIGLAESALFDEGGAIGRSLQSLIIEPR